MTAVARAQPPPSEADRLFEAGRELAHKGDYAGACDKFEKSYALEPALGTQLNLADCDEHLGHLRAAWERYLAAALQAERAGETKRAEFARQRADAVAAKLATIVIDVADPTLPGLAIAIAGRSVPPGREIRDRVDPGDLDVTATAPGKPDFTTKVHAVAGETAIVAIPAAGQPPPPPPPLPPIVDSPRRGRIRLAWGLAAGAGAAAITSVVIGAVARDDYQTATGNGHCAQQSIGLVCDGLGASQVHRAQSLAEVATVFGIGALALGAASAYIYFTAPPVAPLATRTAIGLTWSGRF